MNPPRKDSLRRLYAFFLVNYFAQGATSIVYEPLDYLLKDRLKLSAGQAAGFIAWMTFPLLFKPLFGWISDAMPLGGRRRKAQLIAASLVSAVSFFFLAARARYTYIGLLVPLALAGLALAFADSVCGGILVEDGKKRQQTGRFQAVHIGALYLSIALAGIGSGWLTAHCPARAIFALAGLLPLAIFAASRLIDRPDAAATRRKPAAAAWGFIRTRGFWALSASIFLWSFYPFLGTVQFYYQSNVLKLGPILIGSLMTLGSAAGLLGSAAFWRLWNRDDADAFVAWGPAVMSLVSLAYLFYLGPASAALVEALFGFANVFFRLALLDLIARSCPADAEATCYALFVAVFDVGMYLSNAGGGRMYDFLQQCFAARAHHDQWSAAGLILIGAACTFACRWTLPVGVRPRS